MSRIVSNTNYNSYLPDLYGKYQTVAYGSQGEAQRIYKGQLFPMRSNESVISDDPIVDLHQLYFPFDFGYIGAQPPQIANYGPMTSNLNKTMNEGWSSGSSKLNIGRDDFDFPKNTGVHPITSNASFRAWSSGAVQPIEVGSNNNEYYRL